MKSERGRRRGAAIVLVLAALLLLGTATVLTDSQPPAAVPPGVAEAQTSDPLLHIIQTSTMVGLAPGVAPVPISGRLTNNGAHSTFVATVEVEISSVTAGSESPGGRCLVGDYSVTASRMPVGRVLAPGATTSFTGASLRFRTTTDNQDACQGATIHLLYTAHSS